jgi:Protein of unknown function (DUF5132)
MQIHPTSFLLGLGAALVVPLFTRVFRPLAVEAAVAGMGIVEEGRRLLAEQMETFEDIAAEARARREEMLAEGNGHQAEAAEVAGAGDVPVGSRRRPNGGRRRAS